MIKSTMTNECASIAGHLDGHWSDEHGIAGCSKSRATLDAPAGSRHRATTRSVLPQWPPGQQANKQQSTNTPKKMAMFMAVAVHQYNSARITQWRRSRALLEASGCRHRASIMSNNIKPDMATTVFFDVFLVKTVGKGHGSTLRPLFSIGVLHVKQKRMS